MAEQTPDNTENAPEAEGDQPAAKSKKKWIILALVVLLLVGLTVAGTLWLLSDSGSDSEASETSEPEVEEPAVQAAIYYPLKPEFISNYEVRGRQRYLQVEMTLMLRDNSAVKDIELHMPALRNGLVILLRGQIYAELQTPEGKELLRQQALNTVRTVLEKETGKPVVEQVLFTNLVLQ
jgi:flagellar FliL protein